MCVFEKKNKQCEPRGAYHHTIIFTTHQSDKHCIKMTEIRKEENNERLNKLKTKIKIELQICNARAMREIRMQEHMLD